MRIKPLQLTCFPPSQPAGCGILERYKSNRPELLVRSSTQLSGRTVGRRQSMQCIYCLHDLATDAFRGTEHVVPRSMGSFQPNNLILNDLVCDECNGEFGRTIDLMLGRGSAEAVRRFDYGVQPPGKVAGLRRDRVCFSLNDSGPWDGLLLELVPEGGALAVKPLPQVGFRTSPDGAFTFISEDALIREETILPRGPYSEAGLLVVADSDEMESRLVAALERRGITFRRERQSGAPVRPGELLPVEIRARCDEFVFRCAAKIAFNYLAYCEGRQLVLEKSFCAIRRYVRWGEPASYPLVAVDDIPILADDLTRLRQTNGHLVTVGWAADGRSIVGQVSLFNHARYRVSLARNFAGIWRPIRHGHHFNIESRGVERLAASSLARPWRRPTSGYSRRATARSNRPLVESGIETWALRSGHGGAVARS